MSKALSRVRALVSEIDVIQSQGRKSVLGAPLLKPVIAESEPQSTSTIQQASPTAVTAPVSHETPPNNVIPLQSQASESKIFLQLTGKIAVQLQLEHSDEIVEVRQQGETIEIRFTDGKAIHLPLKSVA